MYKVFVNDKPIILSDQPKTGSEYEMCLFEATRLEEVLHKLRQPKTKGIFLYHTDLAQMWRDFKAYFTLVYAAGGLVVKDQNTYLFIFRNGHWDLPKGRMEKGETEQETALREVEEECGIFQLELVKPLCKSYHVFYENRKSKLKITSWFVMLSDYEKELIPQTEEGISIAKFIHKEKIKDLYPKMYANIRELTQDYLNKI